MPKYVVTNEHLLAEIPANLDWRRLAPSLKSLSPRMTLSGLRPICAPANRA